MICPSAIAALAAAAVIIVLYIAYWIQLTSYNEQPRRPSCRHQQRYPKYAEYFDEEPNNNATSPALPEPPPVNLQETIDFSDVFVTDKNREELGNATQDKNQIQTINDRFRAAKRNVVEFKMKNGVYTNKERRQLVETLLRRPPCGRRVRSWRTENSDYLRGDVRPKASGSTNLIRSAKNNPDVDLHPGALGPMAGMEGQWLSEENLPGNIFQDVEELN